MRFARPGWLSHASEKKEHEVYSCHVSPDGKRLVTAGGDEHARIWSTEAILNAADPAYTKPRQLASLSHHSGTVHSVRFSPNGKYLASGADDKVVCVYYLDPAPPAHTTFGSKEAPPVENWRVYRRLIGHDNDVQDLGWSYDSSILVSVGLDSKVVVWSGSTFEKLKTLAQHQSHVKGITFDPANKYFATASDDRSIKIYRFTPPAANATSYDSASNFMLETTVTAPFITSPLTTYFRRCSWSPDGNHIAAANAVNGPVSSIAIINRGSWESDINLIGHEGPVEVCAFAPKTYVREPLPEIRDPTQPPPQGVTVIACAGQDKTLSIWNTSFSRPFVTTAELCSKPISDLAWNPSGDALYITSLDGTIAAAYFEQGELGYPTSSSEAEKALAKFGAGRRVGIIENPDALKLEEGSKAGEIKGAEDRMGELMGDAAATTITTNGTTEEPAPAPATNGTTDTTSAAAKDPQAERVDKLKQRVTITKDGKKRIAPLLVSGSSQGQSNLPRAQLQAALKTGAAASDDPAGKVLDLNKPYDALPKGGLNALLVGNKRKYAELEGDEDGEKKTEKRAQAIAQTGAVAILDNTPEGLVPTTQASAAAKRAAEIPAVLRPAIVNPSLLVAQTRLAVPAVRSVIVRPLDVRKTTADLELMNGDADTEADVVFEARNATGPSRTGRAQDRDPCRITVSRKSQILWQDFLPRPLLLVTGNRNFWAAACDDGTVHLWTPAGRRMVSPIVLEAQPIILDSRGWWLLAVTAVGQAYVWDIRTMTAAHPPVSLAPALDMASLSQQGHLTAGPALMFARLNSSGRIIIGMSNGDGFAYNAGMYVWQRLSESWWAVGSQYWNTKESTAATSITSSRKPKQEVDESFMNDINPENLSAGIIPLLERNTTSQALLKGRAYFLQKLVKQLLSAEGYEGLEAAVSIAHLENRMAAAVTLGAKDEFKVYLIMYAKRIGSEGLRHKVEELLRGLLGNKIYEEDDEANDDMGMGLQWGAGDDVVGWKREELAKEVVTVLGKHRDLQRITVPYARLLGVFDENQAVAMITDS